VTTAFVPKHFPRTRLASGRVISDAQQYQYDVLRSVGGKLVKDKNGWWRELSDTHREKIFGLNLTAMFKLIEFGLIECVVGAEPGAPTDRIHREGVYVFLVPDLAKSVPGPRLHMLNHLIKRLPSTWSGMCPAGKHGLDYEGQCCDLCPSTETQP
jgi:hypothetical protein